MLPLAQRNAPYAARVASHGPGFFFVEADGLAARRGQKHIGVPVRQPRLDQLVSFHDGYRNDARPQGAPECFQGRFLDQSLASGHHDVMRFAERLVLEFRFRHRQDGPHPVLLVDLYQVADRPSPRRARSFRYFVDAQRVALAVIGEIQQIVVRGRDEHVLDIVLFPLSGPLHADAAPSLLAVFGEGRPFDQRLVRNGDHDLFVFDHVLHLEIAPAHIVDFRAALVGVFRPDIEQLVLDDLHPPRAFGEDGFEAGYFLEDFLVFPFDFLAFETREPAQPQRKNGVGLGLRKRKHGAVRRGQAQALELRRRQLLGIDAAHEVVAGRVGVVRMTNDRNDLIEVVQRDRQAFEDVRPFLRLAEIEPGAPLHDFVPVLHIVADGVLQRDGFRASVHQRHHIHAEGLLALRVFVQLVLHHQRHGVVLYLDDDAQAVPVGFVAQVADALDALFLDVVRDLFEQRTLVDLIGDFRNDERGAARPDFFLAHSGAHHNAPAARLVRLLDAGVAIDNTSRGEVGRRQVFHQALDVDTGVVDPGDDGVDRFLQVVRRDFRGHAHGDAVRAVQEQVGDRRRKDGGFFERAIEILLKIDGFFLDVAQHFLCDARHAGLRVPHGGGGVPVDRPEISLSVHKRGAHGESLGHAHHGVVHRAVPVRVVLSKHFPDHARALLVTGAGGQAQVAHAVQYAPMHGLQPVADVRQRPAYNHRHRIIDVGRLHFLLDIDRDDPRVVRFHAACVGMGKA